MKVPTTLTIRTYPDPVLRRRAAPVDAVTDEIRALINAMFLMMDAGDGVGLAAPQVGVSLRVLVFDPSVCQKDRPRQALVNPIIVRRCGSVMGDEGCLSLPGVEVEVRRASSIDVRALTPEGRPVAFAAERLEARIIQHEIDHLDGILMIDRVLAWKRWRLLRQGSAMSPSRRRRTVAESEVA